MARNYEELQAKLAPEIRARAQARALAAMAAMPWEDLSQAQGLSADEWEKIFRLKLAAGTATLAEPNAIAERMGGRLDLHLQSPRGEIHWPEPTLSQSP